MSEISYLVYEPAARLSVITDALRNAEAEHYRMTVGSPADPTRDERVKAAAAEVERLQVEYKAVEQAASETKP